MQNSTTWNQAAEPSGVRCKETGRLEAGEMGVTALLDEVLAEDEELDV